MRVHVRHQSELFNQTSPPVECSGSISHRCPSACGSSERVGAVDVRGRGRQRLYRLNAHALKPIHDWVKNYERSWSERFDRLDVVLEDLKKEEGDGSE
jgi:hypothetical protein